MIVSLIVAMAQNGVIGKNQQLPWSLPADLKRFKQITLGHPVVMGRKTYESIGRPLPGRENIVISRTAQSIQGVKVATSLDQALAPFLNSDKEVFILGGGEIFKESMKRADRIYQTLILHDVEGDVYFPAVDWSQFKVSFEQRESVPFPFVFRNFERRP